MMPAIPPHSTATTDSAWDGPAAKANLKNDADEAYYRKAFAWQDGDADATTKSAYKFIHHMVSSGGDVGAANLTACSAGIAALNGGRGGANIPEGDRKGVWSHLSKHLKDADKEPPPLSSWEDYVLALDNADNANTETRPSFALAMLADDRPWAIMPRAIEWLLRAARHPDIAAVAARIGQPLANGNGRLLENHNGTAVLDIRGPLFRYRSIFTWLLGGTAVEDAAVGLHAALDDPAVKSIVLAINSPGGQIDGINELANMIRAGNQQKPITAYVDSLAGSGAYWLASAAGRVVADETAQLGSIGVVATVTDDRSADERRGVKRYEVISSQSPLKRTDPATDEGKEQLQQMVDAMAQVFIAKVAGFRGVSEAKVKSDFGRGAVLPAKDAVAAGMADAMGSLEGLLQAAAPDGDPVRRIKDKPGLRVSDGPPVWNIEGTPLGEKFKKHLAKPTAASPTDDPGDDEDDDEEEDLDVQFEEEELEKDDEEDDTPADCDCEDEDDCECDDDEDESEGTEQEPDDSSIPRGETDLIKPTEERQRIAAILTCEEAHGREELARTLALETNHTVDAAKKLLLAAPVASKVNALEARMSQLPNPKVGVPGDAGEDDSPSAEVQRILGFVAKDRKRAHVQ